MPTVLVTGASRGIGRAIVDRMLADGWDVVAGVRTGVQADALRAPRLTPVILDVANAEHVRALAAGLPPRLDAVVNNAGIVTGNPVEGLALEQLRHQLEVNVVGQVAVTQAVLPRLRESRGRIVMISSVNGRVSAPYLGAYNASKFALEALSDALRLELRPWGIRVSLVEPGAIDTDIWRDALDTADEGEQSMSPEHRELYGDALTGLRKTIKRTQKQTIPPEKVAAVVHTALTAPRPRARYLVGVDARVLVGLRAALPARAFDAVFARLTGGR